ncbi:MAG: hypothetical protein RLZZ387_5144 [Chloroflexota bacterium]
MERPLHTQAAPAPLARIRPVALPTEHGGWGFLVEPIILGLLLAPSAAGALLGTAAIGVFLLRHPLELALTDWQKGKRFPRTALAERFAALYALVALIGFLGAVATAQAPFWAALALGAPLALVQLSYDLRKQKRALVPELAGAGALAASAPAILLAAGWELAPALAVWAVLAARAWPAILYVRARIRRLRGAPSDSRPAIAAHVAALLAVCGLVYAGLAPWAAALALAGMLGRALYGLSPRRPAVAPKVIGFTELGLGALTVALAAAGWLLGH